MTERTLAASPNMDGNQHHRSGTVSEPSPSSTRVNISRLDKKNKIDYSFSRLHLHHQ